MDAADLPVKEIERIYAAFTAIRRRYGLEAASRLTYVHLPKAEGKRVDGSASHAVLVALAEPQTVQEVAARLRWPPEQTQGVIGFLRRRGKVAVHHWTRSAKNRKMAVYQVTS